MACVTANSAIELGEYDGTLDMIMPYCVAKFKSYVSNPALRCAICLIPNCCNLANTSSDIGCC